MRVSLPQEIRHDKQGFGSLVKFYYETKDCFLEDIEIDMSEMQWFDADMCAMLGALLYELGEKLNNISLTNIPDRIERIFSKNSFLSHYGHETILDIYSTTIAYKRFDSEDDRYFSEYIAKEFMQRSEIPQMSSGLSRRFHESIFEVFNNAVLHSETELGIFSCGQFFPKRKKLDFLVVDLGVGIRENVNNYKNSNLSSEEAIDWATQGNNTTKKGNVPGGLGLKLLCDFIDLNDGCVQIVSETGSWKRQGKKTEKTALSHPFPGTAVSLEINTADTTSYMLKSESTEQNIF